MMRVKFLAAGLRLLILMLLTQSLYGQDTLRLLWKKSIIGNNLEKDRLGQLYLVNEANELLKLNERGELMAAYNQNRLGPVGRIDAYDPFAVLVYYPEFQVLQMLDRTLNLQWSLDFNLLDLLEIRVVCASNDKQIWGIDRISNRLLKFNSGGEIQTSSPAFSLLSDKIPDFTRLETAGTQVYAFESEAGFWVFDQFGQFVKKIALPGIVDYRLLPEKILYRDKFSWQLYDQQSHLSKELDLPLPEDPFSFLWMEGHWLLLDAGGLQCYDSGADR